MEIICHICGAGIGRCNHVLVDENGIYRIISEQHRADRLYKWDIDRYNQIAIETPANEWGIHPTKPPLRSKITADIIRQHNVKEALIIGTGFGFLEYQLTDISFVSVDQSIEFLKIVHAKHPNKIAIEAVCANLPFSDNSVECLVCESTFHTLNSKSRFLHEVSRVTSPGALAIITIGYRWNCARKPQEGFNITVQRELDTLRMFLEDLGLTGDYLYFDTKTAKWVKWQDEGDYLYIILERG